MSPLRRARSIFGVLFLVALFCAAGLNLYLHGSPVMQALAGIFKPFGLDSFRAGSGEAVARAGRNFIGRNGARKISTDIAVALGKTEMNNFSVIKGADGRLYRGGLFPLDDSNAEALGEALWEFGKAAREAGSNVLYLAAPSALPIEAANPVPGMPTLNYNIASNTLLYELREKGVPFIDTRYAFRTDGFLADDISPKSAFMLKGKAAFTLFAYLLEALERKFVLTLDPDGFYGKIDNYKLTTLPKFFMGGLGKETGPAFSGLDDFTAISPAFETELSIDGIDMFGRAVQSEGDAEKTVLNPKALTPVADLYRLYPESYYVHSNMTRSVVVNPREPYGAKVLLIHDFFTAPLASLLAPVCGELHTLSYQNNLTVSAEEYIREKQFDCVVISLFPPNILRPESQTLILKDGVPTKEPRGNG